MRRIFRIWRVRRLPRRQNKKGNSGLKKENRSKLNRNAGFSLVELLIAVTILAIIVIPLMHLFLTSTRLNVKSRQTLRATTVAQDIMEGLKAYDVDELQQQFNQPLDGFYVVDDKLIKGSVQEESEREKDGSGNAIEGLYYFSMTDVTMQGSRYDALIKVDARGYTDGTADDSVTDYPDLTGRDPMDPAFFEVHNQGHNNKDMAKIGSVVKGKDGMYVQKKSEDAAILDAIWSAFQDEFEAKGVGRTDLDFSTKGFTVSGLTARRRTQIDIADSGSVDEEGLPILTACATVRMYCGYNGKDGYVEHVIKIKNALPTDNPTFTSGKFYVFYYPQYGMTQDEIIINNTSAVPLKQLIVSKQADAELTDSQLFQAEEHYTAYLNLKGWDKNSLVIRTNLGRSLVNDTFLGAESSTKSEDDRVEIGDYVGSMKEINADGEEETVYDFNRVPLGSLKAYTLEGKRMGSSPVEVPEDQTDVIYDVHVAVYKKGAAANGFPLEERVMLLSGSKND